MRRFYFILLICLSFVTVQATENLHRPQKMRGINAEKPHEMGLETDVYIEYAPVQPLTLFLGEELYLSNFLTPGMPIYDAFYTSIGANYTPHKNITLTAAYEFQYLSGNEMRHRLKLMVIPKVFFGDFTLSLRERVHMTYSMTDQSIAWQLRSRLKLGYAIPNTPLIPNVYVELYNPLEKSPASWYSSMSYSIGLDWLVDDHNVLGFFYDFSHSPDSFYHLFGVVYVWGHYK